MRELLGKNFCRLNPPVMELPTLVATSLCRFPVYRQGVIQIIRQNMARPEVREALHLVSRRFLKNDLFWKDNKNWLPLPLGPCDAELAKKIEASLKNNWKRLKEEWGALKKKLEAMKEELKKEEWEVLKEKCKIEGEWYGKIGPTAGDPLRWFDEPAVPARYWGNVDEEKGRME